MNKEDQGRIILYGGGGHAAVMADCIRDRGWNLAGIIADQAPARDWGQVPWLGPYNPSLVQDAFLLLAIGDNGTRKALDAKCREAVFSTIIHQSAMVSPSASIGEGSALFHGTIVQAGTWVGRHVIMNTAASVDHDCILGDYVHIAPGVRLCGNVHVGEGTLIGVGACIKPGVRIGAWAVIGAGAAVVADVPDGALIGGVPAISLK